MNNLSNNNLSNNNNIKEETMMNKELMTTVNNNTKEGETMMENVLMTTANNNKGGSKMIKSNNEVTMDRVKELGTMTFQSSYATTYELRNEKMILEVTDYGYDDYRWAVSQDKGYYSLLEQGTSLKELIKNWGDTFLQQKKVGGDKMIKSNNAANNNNTTGGETMDIVKEFGVVTFQSPYVVTYELRQGKMILEVTDYGYDDYRWAVSQDKGYYSLVEQGTSLDELIESWGDTFPQFK